MKLSISQVIFQHALTYLLYQHVYTSSTRASRGRKFQRAKTFTVKENLRLKILLKHACALAMLRCDVMWCCDVLRCCHVRCDAVMWCDVVMRDVLLPYVMWGCAMMLCDMMGCDAAMRAVMRCWDECRHVVMWCDVAQWCDVMWVDVFSRDVMWCDWVGMGCALLSSNLLQGFFCANPAPAQSNPTKSCATQNGGQNLRNLRHKHRPATKVPPNMSKVLRLPQPKPHGAKVLRLSPQNAIPTNCHTWHKIAGVAKVLRLPRNLSLPYVLTQVLCLSCKTSPATSRDAKQSWRASKTIGFQVGHHIIVQKIWGTACHKQIAPFGDMWLFLKRNRQIIKCNIISKPFPSCTSWRSPRNFPKLFNFVQDDAARSGEFWPTGRHGLEFSRDIEFSPYSTKCSAHDWICG